MAKKRKNKAWNRGDGKREANGRLDRKLSDERRMSAHDREQRETMSVAIGARQRIFGLNEKLARDQLSGSVVGRYALMGTQGGGISRQQADAAFIWLEDREAYSRAMQSPPNAGAMDMAHVPGRTHAENVGKTRAAVKTHNDAREALQAAQNVLGLKSNLWAAINLIVEQDRDLPHMIGDLREALNALGFHYGIIPKAKKEAA